MKRIALLLPLLLCGCANIHQVASVIGRNPKGEIETRTTTQDATTLFTAKQVVEKLSASNTSKNQRLGASGIDQQTSMQELIQLIQALGPIMAAAQQNSMPKSVVIQMVPAPTPMLVPEQEILIPGP